MKYTISLIRLPSYVDWQRESATLEWKWANWWARECGDSEPAFLRRPEMKYESLESQHGSIAPPGLTNFDDISSAHSSVVWVVAAAARTSSRAELRSVRRRTVRTQYSFENLADFSYTYWLHVCIVFVSLIYLDIYHRDSLKNHNLFWVCIIHVVWYFND